MASIGVVRSAQYPQTPTSTKNAITRKRFLSETSMSQLITRATSPGRPSTPRTRTDAVASLLRHKRQTTSYAERRSDFGGSSSVGGAGCGAAGNGIEGARLTRPVDAGTVGAATVDDAPHGPAQ